MANQEQLAIIKQGVKVWNQWRREHADIRPDLRFANFGGADLSGADLSGADLGLASFNTAYLRGADLSRAYLANANLSGATLFGTRLRGAYLFGADLSFVRRRIVYSDSIDGGGVDLNSADLRGADLSFADLSFADLRGVDLSEADLSNLDNHIHIRGANLTGADLSFADLSRATVGMTIFSDVDLRTVKGLETIDHKGPSSIGIDTIIRSQGKMPEVFLRNAGVPDSVIEAIPSLLGSLEPIHYDTCFISYSSKDEAFVKRLHADLQSKRVRCWFAPEDLKIGEKFWHRIDESIRQYDRLLVVLSRCSVDSAWVEREVMAALEKERQQEKLALFPITLDDAFKQTSAPWAADLRRQRHIGDFTHWKNNDDYEKAFSRLLRDLKADPSRL